MKSAVDKSAVSAAATADRQGDQTTPPGSGSGSGSSSSSGTPSRSGTPAVSNIFAHKKRGAPDKDRRVTGSGVAKVVRVASPDTMASVANSNSGGDRKSVAKEEVRTADAFSLFLFNYCRYKKRALV